MSQTVGARLTLEVIEPADVMLQIAVAHPTHDALEIVEVDIPGSGRVHRFQAEKGRVEVNYSACISGHDPLTLVSAADEICYLRPSRYAESDRLMAIAQAEFAGIAQPDQLLPAISSWVGTQLSYVPGSSRPT